MSVNRTKLSSGGEIGEVNKKRSFWTKKIEKFRALTAFRQIVVIFGLLVTASVIFTVIWYVFNFVSQRSQSSSAKAQYTQEFLKSNDSDETKSQLVEKYGAQYDDLIKKTLNSNPANWNKTNLDDAYAALLYADKMGVSSQVYNLLGFIEAAKKLGLNIDDNSYGITQETRDVIKKRAETRIQQAVDKAGKKN